MNFLSAALNTLTGKTIPYTYGDLIQNINSNRPWKINAGLNKDNKQITIFTFEVDQFNQHLINKIDNGCRIHKMFSVLPGILKLEDFIKNERGTYLITPVIEILDYDKYNNELAVLGLYQILCALKLIHERSVTHNGGVNNNLLDCIYVSDTGEWKLSGFENAIENTHDFKYDCQIVGEAIYKLFKSNDYNKNDAMKVSGSQIVHNMPISNLITGKWSIEKFINEGEKPHSWFDTMAIRCYRKFEEFHIIEMFEKMELFKSMAFCDGINEKFLVNKGLVEMSNTFDLFINQDNISKGQILSQLIYLMYSITGKVEIFKERSYQVYKNCIFKAMALSDRSVRLVVLKTLPKCMEFLTDYEIQDKIYPQMALGFVDTDLMMRTETLNAIGLVINKITDRQLNNDLLRHLAKLQVDPNPILRINVLLTLMSIAPQMHASTRSGILVTAFGKGLRDSHVKVRLTAVDAFKNTLSYFEPETCCTKVIGALSPAMVDKSADVRRDAQVAMKECMKKIEQFVQSMGHSGESIDEIDNNQLKLMDINELGNNLLLEIPELGEINLSKTKTYSSNAPTPVTSVNNSKNDLGDIVNKPKINHSSFTKLTLDDDIDEGWDLDGEYLEDAKPIKKKTSIVKTSNKKRPGITLSKKTTASKIKIEVKMDDDDGGWGDGW